MSLLRRIAFIGAFLASGQAAWACKLVPEASDLRAFLAAKNPAQVVFLARVERTEAFDGGPGTRSAQRILLRASTWWRGSSKELVNAEGYVEVPRGTSCDGIADFSVNEKEDWLIVGSEINGLVKPWSPLSVRLHNGELPRELQDILRGAK